jgi:hypothetical protein
VDARGAEIPAARHKAQSLHYSLAGNEKETMAA